MCGANPRDPGGDALADVDFRLMIHEGDWFSLLERLNGVEGILPNLLHLVVSIVTSAVLWFLQDKLTVLSDDFEAV